MPIKAGAIRIEVEGVLVHLLVDGKLASTMPWEAAKLVSKLLMESAVKAEEYATAHDMITVQATLIKAGITIPVVNDPEIYREAQKEARWNKKL